MEFWQYIFTIVCSVLASSGFWAFMQKRSEKSDVRTKMLQGLAHDRLMYLAIQYTNRGWLSRAEYENLHTYLYKPYLDLGGNGAISKLMEDVYKLPIKDFVYEMLRKEELTNE